MTQSFAVFEHHLEILEEPQKKLWHTLKTVRDQFVLYCGTALALRLGHRQSIDFDFFTHNELDKELLVSSLPILERADIIQSEKNTYTALVPASNGRFVKISFFGTITFGRLDDSELTSDETLRVASLIDLFATKLKVIMQRVEPKDYIDIAAILREGMKLEEGLAGTAALFGKQFSPSDCLRALEYFEDPCLSELHDNDKKIIKDTVDRVLDLDTLPVMETKSASLF